MKQKRPITPRAPSIKQLAKQLDKFQCGHMMGREVIEKQIADLAIGRIAKDYCQNWDRCPDNGWGNCTPDLKEWAFKLGKPDYRNIFSNEEIRIISELKMQRI